MKLRSLAPLLLAPAAACGSASDNPVPAAVRQCMACHTFTQGGRNAAGPNLFDIIGEKAGVRPGFMFSPAMKASDIVWTPETLDAFIAAPQQVVPGTRMGMAGEQDPVKRRAIVQYIQSLKPETNQ